VTVKLYDRDHYLGEFDARVVGVEGDAVELDQTAFYAEAGGQAGDTGILHFMESPPGFSQGDRVHGVVDWDRRYRIMKLHTASHIMEYYLWMHLGYAERTGSFVDERKDRADYKYEERLDPDKLRRVEEDTNRFLSEGHPVTGAAAQWRCTAPEPTSGTPARSGRSGSRERTRAEAKSGWRQAWQSNLYITPSPFTRSCSSHHAEPGTTSPRTR
jgi:hypothetical protein